MFFQDEARIGQKGRVCHIWWKRGERPPGLCDKRFTSAYIFAAVEPGTDNAFALVLPYADTAAMQAKFLKTEIAVKRGVERKVKKSRQGYRAKVLRNRPLNDAFHETFPDPLLGMRTPDGNLSEVCLTVHDKTY